MEPGCEDEVSLDETELSRLRDCLRSHGVTFAMVFGSVAKDEATADSDLDLAVAFETHHPEDDGYSDLFLELRSELDRVTSFDIDLVDVYTMPESFASAVFDGGEVILGSETERATLESELTGDEPSKEEAKNRVAAAVERLRENGDTNPGRASD